MPNSSSESARSLGGVHLVFIIFQSVWVLKRESGIIYSRRVSFAKASGDIRNYMIKIAAPLYSPALLPLC